MSCSGATTDLVGGQYFDGSGLPLWINFVFAPYATTPGNYYKIWATGDYGSALQILAKGGNPVPGASFAFNGSSLYSNNLALYARLYSSSATPHVIALGDPIATSSAVIFQLNQQKTFTLFWQACDGWDSIQKVGIQASLNGLGYDPGIYVIDKSNVIGPQMCQGFIKMTDNYLNFSTSTAGSANFTITTYDSDGFPIASSTSNTLVYSTASSKNFVYYLSKNPLEIDLGDLSSPLATQASTTIFFSYNFSDLDTPINVCAYRYGAGTSTPYCAVGPFNSTSTAIGAINIPTPNISTSNNYSIYAFFPDSSSLHSQLFSIVWAFKPVSTATNCSIPAYDYSHVCDGIDTSNLLGEMLCALKGGLILGAIETFRPSCDSLNYFQDEYSTFKQAPPFNIYYQFSDTISSALASTTIASTTTFGLPMYNKASSSFFIVPILSSSSMTNAIGTENNSLFRDTISFIIWSLAVVLVVWTIYKL